MLHVGFHTSHLAVRSIRKDDRPAVLYGIRLFLKWDCVEYLKHTCFLSMPDGLN